MHVPLAQRRPAVALRSIAIAAVVGALICVAALPRYAVPRNPAAPDFALTDQDGRPFRLSGLVGHPVVVFFGYTHCPDECPATLARLARAVHGPGVPADRRVVFITVDPARDSAPALKRYIRLFDPAFFALTGALQTLAPVYRAYHVTRTIEPGEHGMRDYSVNHSLTLFFIGRDGTVKGFGTWDESIPALMRDLRTLQ